MSKYQGILVAMDEELEGILELIKDKEEQYIGDTLFHIGKIGDTKVVIAKTGVGKVHAARTTMIMHYEYKLKSLINIGVAGAINPTLTIGDVVIGKACVQHDFDITAFNHKKGYIPSVGDQIPCSVDMLDWCKPKIVEEKNEKIKAGIVASGDIFCTKLTDKYEIYRVFDADAVDMEGASIAQVCYLNKLPFISIKVISDSPSGNNEIEYENNLEYACKKCGNIIAKLLEGEK